MRNDMRQRSPAGREPGMLRGTVSAITPRPPGPPSLVFKPLTSNRGCAAGKSALTP